MTGAMTRQVHRKNGAEAASVHFIPDVRGPTHMYHHSADMEYLQTALDIHVQAGISRAEAINNDESKPIRQLP